MPAYEVLATFTDQDRVLCMMDIGEAIGKPKATTHRLLNQLVELGVLDRFGFNCRIDTRLYTLGSLSAEESLRDLALPYLHELHRAIDGWVI